MDSRLQPGGNWNAASLYIAVVHTWAWFCSNFQICHTKGQFCLRLCLLGMESCSKLCVGSPFGCSCLLPFWHLQLSRPSWINKSLHCHNGALLTPGHSHASMCTFTHTQTHTNIRLVIEEGSGTQTKTHTHTYKTPDRSQICTFLTLEWDPQPFPRLRALSDKDSCYVSPAVQFLIHSMFQQRSADIMVSALLMDVWLQDLPSLAGADN